MVGMTVRAAFMASSLFWLWLRRLLADALPGAGVHAAEDVAVAATIVATA
jgi:hypothetical protein